MCRETVNVDNADTKKKIPWLTSLLFEAPELRVYPWEGLEAAWDTTSLTWSLTLPAPSGHRCLREDKRNNTAGPCWMAGQWLLPLWSDGWVMLSAYSPIRWCKGLPTQDQGWVCTHRSLDDSNRASTAKFPSKLPTKALLIFTSAPFHSPRAVWEQPHSTGNRNEEGVPPQGPKVCSPIMITARLQSPLNNTPLQAKAMCLPCFHLFMQQIFIA